jgi:hypothetical protein
LDVITMHALSSDREKRYSSVRALMADLRRYLNGDALAVKPTRRRSFNRPLLAAAVILPLAAGWMIYSKANQDARKATNTALVESDYRNFTFEEIGFITLTDEEKAIPPFDETRNFTWVRFRKPDGGEFILSYDGLFGSPTVTQFFTGAQRPDDPAAKVIPIDSKEDKKLVALYEGLIENAIGLERAAELDATPWGELPKGEGSAQLRMLKNLYGAVMFFKNHRHRDGW